MDEAQEMPDPHEAEAAQYHAQMQARAEQLHARFYGEQNLALGFVGGVAAAVLGGVIWAAVTVATRFQIGYMAVGVGFLVGHAVRVLGKGVDKSFGYCGGGLALFGCILGNLLSICGMLAVDRNVPVLQMGLALCLQPQLAVQLIGAGFHPMDVIFYWIAIYEGYRFSFRVITPEEKAWLVGTVKSTDHVTGLGANS